MNIFIIHQPGPHHSLRISNSTFFLHLFSNLTIIWLLRRGLAQQMLLLGLCKVGANLIFNGKYIVMRINRTASLAAAFVFFSAAPTAWGAIGILSDSSDLLGKICYSFVLTLPIMQLIPPLVLLAFFIAAAIRCLGSDPVKEQRQPLRGGKL